MRELRNIRTYRAELRKPDVHLSAKQRAYKAAWVRVGDELLNMLREEPDGEARAR